MLLSGYSVVSLPELNYVEDTEVELFRKAPQVNGVYYAGYQRNEFGDMDKFYREGRLPEDIKKMYSRVRDNQNRGLYDYSLTGSYEDAFSMKNYLNANGERYEVIGLYSKVMESYLGHHQFKGKASFLGYDINADGYSVVLTCFFEKADLFKDELGLMNGNGLLQDVESASVLVDKYISIQGQENMEQIARGSVDVIAVYKLCC